MLSVTPFTLKRGPFYTKNGHKSLESRETTPGHHTEATHCGKMNNEGMSVHMEQEKLVPFGIEWGEVFLFITLLSLLFFKFRILK